MLDFRELPDDGNAFELLIREIAFTEGYSVHWSGVGPDGGKDLVCRQTVKSILGEFEKVWVIQCKHFAHAGRSVGTNDIQNVVDVCRHHGADGYVVATSTHPSSSLVQRLESFATRSEDRISTSVWDATFIERILSTTENWAIAQRFFPVSAQAAEWRVSATTSPNRWVVTFKGHTIHLSNRIGSQFRYHFDSIRSRLADLEKIKLPEGHFFRLRAVWYDDKNGGYQYYIDYMLPYGRRPAYSKYNLKKALGDGWALDDGQVYSFDVVTRQYNDASDHYDPDHYDYYVPYSGSFLIGERRFVSDDMWDYDSDDIVVRQDDRPLRAMKDDIFDRFKSALGENPAFKLIKAANSAPEAFALYSDEFDISSFVERQELSLANAFTAEFIFIVHNDEKFYEFITLLPQSVEIEISVFKKRVFLPADDRRSKMSSDDDDGLYVIQITANDFCYAKLSDVRAAFNKFYLDAIENIGKFKSQQALRPRLSRLASP
jgi:hypothetical protein